MGDIQGGQTDRHTVFYQTGVDCGKMSSPVVVNAFTSMISVNGKEDMMTELFPSNILTDLDLACSSASFSPPLTISREEWEDRFQAMKSCKDTYYVVVIEDVNLARVIGAATLVVEKKFIHSCGLVGRLEDVVVSDVYRGKQLGKLVVATASLLATKLGCYKITLNCNDKMIKFYSAMGYKSEDGNANYMCIRVQGKPREPQA